MKTIGLIGGMSWESTATYYTLLNRGVNDRLGKLHSAKIIMTSVDFQTFEERMRKGDWHNCGKSLAMEARRLESAGAEILLLCTNTLHKVAETIEAAISIPFIHICDTTAIAIRNANINTVGLLGTSFTMEDDFYRNRLESMHGLKVIIPKKEDRQLVHRVIFDELCRGKIENTSKEAYLQIIDDLQAAGAEAVIEGCTEIEMLLHNSPRPIPLFDTTSLHVEEAINQALSTCSHRKYDL